MFIGHSFLAFALAGLLARYSGRSADDAVRIAAVAALFALTPDADILFALPGLLSATPIADFWAASTQTHRAVTHSLLVALPVGVIAAIGLRRHRRTGTVLLASVVAVVWILGGPLAGTVTAIFAIATAGVAAGAEAFGVPERWSAVAAIVGLGSHPFGDIFTGTPPAVFWPAPVRLFDGRVAPMPDATLDFLLAFGFELAAIWAGTLVALWLLGRGVLVGLRTGVRRRAAIGAAYAAAVVVVPTPTVDFAYPFVFSVLPVGVIGIDRRVHIDREAFTTAWLTGLAAVTLAVSGYAIAYLLW